MPYLHRLVQIHVAVKRSVFSVAPLDHAWNLDEVDARSVVERARDRRAGNDQNVQAAIVFDQRVRNGPASAQMTESEGVMTVHENACML